MAPTKPNKSPGIINRSKRFLNLGVEPVYSPRKKKKEPKINPEAYKFKSELLDEKYEFTFVCASCTGLPPYKMQVPVKLFIDAVVNKPANVQNAKIVARDRMKALITSNAHVNKFTTVHVRTIGDNLTKLGKIPFNPFRPANDRLRVKHAGMLDNYAAQYFAFDQNKIVAVKGVPPEIKVTVKPSEKIVKLSRDKTFEAVGEDKNLARKYLDFEEALDKPRVSVTRRMKQILGESSE